MGKAYGVKPSVTQPPATPTDLTLDFRTAYFFILSVEQADDANLWTFYVNGVPYTPVNVPTITISGLAPSTAYNVQAQATNSAGSSSVTAIQVFTTLANTAPSLNLPDQVIEEDVPFSVDLASSVVDPDGQPLTYAITSGSVPGLALVGSVYSGTPTTQGTTNVVFSVSDGYATSPSTVEFVVTGFDTESPSDPTNCVAVASGSTVTVTWTQSTDNVAVLNYDVERAGTGLIYSLRGTVADPFFQESGVPDGIRNYRVRARDTSSNLSGYGIAPPVEVIPNPPAPDAPIIDSIVPASSQSIAIDWHDGPSGAATVSYELDRSPNGSTGWFNIFSGMIGTAATPQFVEDTGLSPSTQYFYRVRAFAAGNVAGPYATGNATTLGINPGTAQFKINLSSGKNSGTTLDFNALVPEDSATARKVLPGEIVELVAGTHRDKVFNNILGSASQPIIIRGPQTGTTPAIFRRTSSAVGGFILRLGDSRHFIFDGESTTHTPNVKDGKRRNIKFMYPTGSTNANPDNFTCFIKFHSGNTTATYKATRDCTIRFCEFDGGWYNNSGTNVALNGTGIQINTDSDAQNRANPGVGGVGIYPTAYQENIIIEHNNFKDLRQEAMYLGENIYHWTRSGQIGKVPVRYIKVRYNYMYNMGSDGILFKSVLDGTLGFNDAPTDNSCHHNVSIRSGSDANGNNGALGAPGIATSTARINIYNNYIEDTGSVGLRHSVSEGADTAKAQYNPPITEGHIFNNIVVRSGILDANSGNGILSRKDTSNTAANSVRSYVYNNTCVDNAFYGIWLNPTGTAGAHPDSYARNNICIGNLEGQIGYGNSTTAGADAATNLTTGTKTAIFNGYTTDGTWDDDTLDLSLKVAQPVSGSSYSATSFNDNVLDPPNTTFRDAAPDKGAYEFPNGDQLDVYPAVTGKASSKYTMTVSQGTSQTSPVLMSNNPYWSLIDGSNVGLTRRNHWSQFSFEGAPVTVVVTGALGVDVSNAVVRPLIKGITPTINTTARTITFQISTPGQYFVYIPSQRVLTTDVNSGDPLFIFASAVDTNVPVVNGTTIVNYDSALDVGQPRSGATTVVFPAGIHELDPTFNNVDSGTAVSATTSTLRLRAGAAFADNELAGYRVIITSATAGANQIREILSNVGSTDTVTLTENWTTTPTGTIVYEVTKPAATSFKLNYGDEIYIKGGAWVKGKIQGLNAGTGLLKIRGRGTLCGEQYLTLADLAANEIAINIATSTTSGNSVEASGITIMDSPRKNFICNDASFDLYDMKCIGITGDFATMSNNSTMDLCFTKLNDDHSKFFGNNCTITNHTAYMQKVGPVSHISWQVTGNFGNNVLDGVDVVGADRPNLTPSQIGSYTQFISNAIVICTNLGNNGVPGHAAGNIYRNVRSDVPVYMPVGLWTKWNLTGFDEGLGDIDNMTFQNWSIAGQATFCVFNGNGTLTGRVTNCHFDNFRINGVKVVSANRGTYFKWLNLDDQATFTYV
jgi:hypothetical protein